MFLTVGKTSIWNVKGTDSESDNDCDFGKPTAKRKKEKCLTKHMQQLGKVFKLIVKFCKSGVRVN